MRNYILVGIIFIGFAGCATYGYDYYYLSVPSNCYDQGVLLGRDPKHDKPFAVCRPDANSKAKCVVQEQNEYYALLKDYNRLKIELSDCQRGH